MYSLCSLYLTFACFALNCIYLIENKNPHMLLQGFCVWGNYQKVGILLRSLFYRQVHITKGCIGCI